MKAQGGLSSVELAVGTMILLIMLGALLGVQNGVMGLLNATSTIGDIDERAQRAIEKVSSEVKWAELSSFLLTTESGASRIDLRVPTDYVGGAAVWSSTITYKVELGTFDANGDGILNDYHLIRIQNGLKRVVCENVAAGGFLVQRTSQNLVLDLRLEKAASKRVLKNHASTSISLRN